MQVKTLHVLTLTSDELEAIRHAVTSEIQNADPNDIDAVILGNLKSIEDMLA